MSYSNQKAYDTVTSVIDDSESFVNLILWGTLHTLARIYFHMNQEGYMAYKIN